MQSHLTRRVFRAILNNEPLSSSRCRTRLLHNPRIPRSRRPVLPSSYNVQRRGMIAFSVPPPGPPPETLPSEVGLKPMRDLMRALKHRNRGPSNSALAKGFLDFFSVRERESVVITGFHARLLSLTWKHLRAHADELEPDEYDKIFSDESLGNMLFILSQTKCLPESHDTIRKVARFVFLELCSDRGYGPNKIARPSLMAYISMQALNGNPEEARHVVEFFGRTLRSTGLSPWLTVMEGFAIKNDRHELRRTVNKLNGYGITFDPSSHEKLVMLLIEQDFLDSVKMAFECPLSNGREPTLTAKKAAIKYAVLKSDTSWAAPIFASLSQAPIAKTLSTTLLWEAAHGKNANAIADKLKTLTTGESGPMTALNINCVNNLLEYANSINNPLLAAEFAALPSQWGLEPDVQTHILRLESFIQAQDVNATLECLENMYEVKTMVLGNLPLMNKLITMLCLSVQEDSVLDRISAFLDPLFDNNVRLESSTLAALTHLLLYRHNWEGVSELLRPRLALYDSTERTEVRKVLTDFITDPAQEDDKTWQAYELLQLAFPETGVGMRSEIMLSFFRRNRSDQAFLVFGHMRQAEDFSRRPKPDTYVKCFRGIAQTRNAENLETVHNMLKLDVWVNLNTKLLNGLMLAYAVCDMPEKSMEVFRDILHSEEGPTHKTIGIFFKLCENHPNGVQEAIKMMSKVKVLGIELDRPLYTGYVEALAAQCELVLAFEALDMMHPETGCSPTQRSIGLLYNAAPYQYWKDEVEQWAKEKYPELWGQLEVVERTEHEEGLRFNIDSNDIIV